MITKIGFKNFRRFKEYTEVELGDINMFVGGNNAGKSTVVKALLLVTDFLKNTKVTTRSLFETPKFSFSTEHVNIDSFARAKNWYASKEDEIAFSVTLDYFDVTINLFSGSEQNQEFGDLSLIEVYDSHADICYTFNFKEHTSKIAFDVMSNKEDKSNNEVLLRLNNLRNEIEARESLITQNFNTPSAQGDIAIILSELTQLKAEFAELEKNLKDKNHVVSPVVESKLSQDLSIVGRNYISSLISGISANAIAEQNKTLLQQIHKLKASATEFEESVESLYSEYIYAHSAVQEVLYNKKDNNDRLSQCINELYTLRITEDSSIGKLMVGWFKDFAKIENYSIKPVSAMILEASAEKKLYVVGQGEGLAFAVKYKGQWHDLGDMGRGTIQLAILFMNLAIILKKNEGSTIKPLVLIEEPEQNLHPAVQSKLVSLFYKLNKKIRMVIETHSEYVIRKTQVVVAEDYAKGNIDYENNPFIVYFFPSNGVDKPYKMLYREDGNFENEFGPGFYDEATNLLFEIL